MIKSRFLPSFYFPFISFLLYLMKIRKIQIYFPLITQGVIAHSHDQSVRYQIKLEFRSSFLWRGENRITWRKTICSFLAPFPPFLHFFEICTLFSDPAFVKVLPDLPDKLFWLFMVFSSFAGFSSSAASVFTHSTLFTNNKPARSIRIGRLCVLIPNLVANNYLHFHIFHNLLSFLLFHFFL